MSKTKYWKPCFSRRLLESFGKEWAYVVLQELLTNNEINVGGGAAPIIDPCIKLSGSQSVVAIQRGWYEILCGSKRIRDRAKREGHGASGFSGVDGKTRISVGLTARCGEKLGIYMQLMACKSIWYQCRLSRKRCSAERLSRR